MADIHVRTIAESAVGRGTCRLIYHIPIDSPVANVVPTPVSAIASELDQAEIDALAAGILVELGKDIQVSDGQTQAQVASAIKTDWQNVKTEYNRKYNFEHKFYGVTLDAGP